jgi:hypothetical protein
MNWEENSAEEIATYIDILTCMGIFDLPAIQGYCYRNV